MCSCFFCKDGKPHPDRHKDFRRVSSRLLVAESLDPKDWVPMEACTTCGHQREVQK